ncbi:MAG: hypothetical protein R3Y10_11905 [Ferrimonas sp.]
MKFDKSALIVDCLATLMVICTTDVVGRSAEKAGRSLPLAEGYFTEQPNGESDWA